MVTGANRAMFAAMRSTALALIAVAACGHDISLSPDASNSGGDGSGPGQVISGMITSDQTWSGWVAVTGPTTIATGVNVTVVAGAQIRAASTAMITIDGKIEINGTSAAHVVIKPST